MTKAITEDGIREFENSLRENERSEATIRKYGAALRKFMLYLGGEDLTKQKLLSYREQLLESRSAQTVNGVLSAVNSYLKFTGMEECKVKLLRLQRKTFIPPERELSRKEFSRLVETARAQKRERLALLMETIGATGIRVSEVRYITVEAAGAGRTDISLKGKIRTILLPKALCRKLVRYARERKITAGEIFLTANKTPVSRTQIWAEMKSLCAAAKVEPGKVFPHNLRHLFARCYYQESKDVVKLADVLGHSSIQTTRIYLMTSGMEHMHTLNRLRLVS